MREGLTFDDVLLVPKESPVQSRSDVAVSVTLGGEIDLEVPILSSSMDSVTGAEMAQAMADVGGAGIIHRFCPIEEQVAMVESVDGVVGAAIGISEERNQRADRLVNAGADFLCIDVAHGHLRDVSVATDVTSKLFPRIPIMAGAVATLSGSKFLSEAGSDIIRTGVGPGSTCLTREVAGVGVPQITAIQETSAINSEVSVVADGGVKNSGDVMKTLVAGADAVVLGGLLGACEESLAPIVEEDGQEYKEIRGMASRGAQEAYDPEKSAYVEGGSYKVPIAGTVAEKINSLEKGIRSGLSYCGGHTIHEARENAEFIRVSPNTVRRNGIHGGE